MNTERGMTGRIALLLILLLAVALRLGAWPQRFEMRDIDEPGYVEGGLQLFEGIIPAYKNAPGGPVFWTGWVYTAAKFTGHLASPTPEERQLPFQIRVFAVMERTLMENYHDLSKIREIILSLNFLLGLLAVYAAFIYGRYRGGMAGAIGGALLMATLPLFVEMGAMSRPYSMSWSLGIMAIAAAGTLNCNRLLWAVVLMGMAVGTRIEAILLLPFVVWEFLDRRSGKPLFGEIFKLILGTIAVSILVSPWMPVAFFGMLRAIATIQVATTADKQVPVLATLGSALFDQGMGLALLAALGSVVVLFKRKGASPANILFALYVVLMFASTFKSTGFGLHHKGPQVVGMVLASLTVLGWISERKKQLTWVAAIGVGIWPGVLAAKQVIAIHSKPVDFSDSVIVWAEKYIPAGTRVYVPPLIKTLMPTSAAADRAWSSVIAPDAYIKKLESGMKRFAVSADGRSTPRAMSEENVVQERGNRRRWFILGGYSPDAKKYDVDPRTSLVFGTTNVYAAFMETGGVLIVRPNIDGPAPEGFRTPDLIFRGPIVFDTWVYISPALREKLPSDALTSHTP